VCFETVRIREIAGPLKAMDDEKVKPSTKKKYMKTAKKFFEKTLLKKWQLKQTEESGSQCSWCGAVFAPSATTALPAACSQCS
jgi:uncharacterized OB-fold protein